MPRSRYVYIVKDDDEILSLFTVKWELLCWVKEFSKRNNVDWLDWLEVQRWDTTTMNPTDITEETLQNV